jgi:cytochrome c peroxidase
MRRWAFTLTLFLGLFACEEKKRAPDPRAAPEEPQGTTAAAGGGAGGAELDESLLPAFGALPDVMSSPDNAITDDEITLGRALYYDTRLSASNETSCNTCHVLTADGADSKPTSIGHNKQSHKHNAPTVYNAAGHFVQFWDGRAKTVEAAMQDEKSVVGELRKVKWYREQFSKAFPGSKADPVNMENLAKAIGAFERKLVTPSRWDKFLKGDRAALTAQEKAGFKKFTDTGCNTCHAGPYVGGAMFQKLGLVKPWPKQDDLGRYEVTKQDVDKMMFKVPSLRNVEKTSPYFHDGSVSSLEEAVKLMAHHQLGKELTDADAQSIIAFLKTLTGEVPKDFITSRAEPARSPAAGP